ncbi:MAG: right-handed parallel beta-helix repeat-containing protein, partial [Actinomycetota bacterium]|nr:right-handed parallel beta-helix repeat-containing protein [Actinomycetota bacterium]
MSGTTVDGGTERSDGTSAIECLASFVSVERASNTITVSPGAGTLAEAVGKAQDGDTLILQDGTYTSAGNRRRVLENLGKRLTIKAFNRRKAILDGQDRDRVAMLSGTVTIEGLVLTKGFVPDGWVVGGAGLSIRRGSVATVTNCEITLNSAQNGGGVDMPEAAEATFTDCDIHDNVARTVSAGIGMQRRNKATFTNCNIYNNRALAGSSGGGTLAGEVRMENCRIYDNTASMNGGGLTINGNDRTDPIRSDRVELVNNIIEGNSAGGHGGGLDLRSTGPVSTTGGQIRGNSANSGGRNIFVTGTPSQVCLAMSGTTVDGGTERSDGTSAIECLASFVSVERASNTIT